MTAAQAIPAVAPEHPHEPGRITVVEHAASGYASRTRHNANSAGLTVAIAADFSTAGERLTASASHGRYLAIPIDLEPAKAGLRLAKALRYLATDILNVAGNGMHTLARHRHSQSQVNQHVYAVLAAAHSLLPIRRIVTGGQTGVDIAGAIAACKLQIPVVATMPAGFMQRGADGVDSCGTAASVTQQIIEGAAALLPAELSSQVDAGVRSEGVCARSPTQAEPQLELALSGVQT